MQLLALKRYGCKKIFEEKKSGRTTRRAQYQKVLASLKPGDTLVFWHIDRLGRNARELINLEYDLHEDGIHIVSLTQNIETITFEGRYKFQKDCIDAEYESGRTSLRTREGLKAAALRGHYPGQQKCLNAQQVKAALRLQEQKLTTRAIGKKLNCSAATISRALKPDYLTERKGRHVCQDPHCNRISCIRKKQTRTKPCGYKA